jgi:hypothetical protein
MKNSIAIKSVLLVLCVVLLLCTGCSKMNRENYDKLKMGMSYKEATTLLGQSDTCDSAMGAKSCTWGSEQKNISVKFVADKVVFFSSKGL